MALLATVGIGLALVFTPVGQNAFAGFLAGIDNTASEGDVISVGDKVGTVVRRGTLSTGVEFPDGSMVYMPNTSLIDDELTNHNRVDGARLEVEIKLDGSPNRSAAVDVMKSTLDALEWRRSDKPIAVLFSEIGSNAFHYRCQAWVDRRLEEPVRTSDMRTALVDALESSGISVGETGNLSASDFVLTHVTNGASKLEAEMADADGLRQN